MDSKNPNPVQQDQAEFNQIVAIGCINCFHCGFHFGLLCCTLSFLVCLPVCLCLFRACQSSGPGSFKPLTSANQNRNKILRLCSTFSSSTTPRVENRNTSAFLPLVSSNKSLKSQSWSKKHPHSLVLTRIFCSLSDKDSQSVSIVTLLFHFYF